MYGIADLDNCYCSCEKVFRPDLEGKPIVCLSNNDGCVVARSNEAKKMGISSCKVHTERCQHYYSHYRRTFESWHLAGHLLLRVPQLWWFQGVGSDNHRRISYYVCRR